VPVSFSAETLKLSSMYAVQIPLLSVGLESPHT
jgi:hypothetical protein